MALGKDQLRKFHGIPEPTRPIDPAVFARRRSHVAAAKWLAKWSWRLQAMFALIGLIVVFLPTISKPWRAAIENTSIVTRIFHDYSTLSDLAMANFFILNALFLVRGALIKYMPGAGSSGLTYRDVMEMELYPRTIKEELAYWIDIAYGAAGTSLWLFLPFGVLAYFFRIGS